MNNISRIFIIIFIVISNLGFAQTLNYKISSGNNSLGNITVTKTENKNVLQIEAYSEVRLKLFITIDLKYKLNCTYKDKELIFSSVSVYVNGKLHSTTTTEKDGNFYSIIKNGHTSKFIDKITFSGALLYFEEPKNISMIFSDFHALKKPIKEIGVNEYQITNPKSGHLSKYVYINGILKTATIQHDLMNFTLTKI